MDAYLARFNQVGHVQDLLQLARLNVVTEL